MVLTNRVYDKLLIISAFRPTQLAADNVDSVLTL
jgi:hypothetical protein